MLGLLILNSLSLQSHSTKSQKMNSEKIKIEIWSDVVCPFCYIGKKKIEQAVAKLGAEDKVEITWHSFQLDPDFPADKAIPSMSYLSERKGYPIDQVVAMSGQLTAQGKAYGIQFNFDSALTFNTLNAHRLIQWAKTQHKANELKEAFMIAYFSNGTDLTLEENVLSVVKKAGLDEEAAANVLASSDYLPEVNADILRAQKLGISGVPYFLINGSQPIYGAQSDAVFENALAAALKNLKTADPANGEGVCLPSGECK